MCLVVSCPEILIPFFIISFVFLSNTFYNVSQTGTDSQRNNSASQRIICESQRIIYENYNSQINDIFISRDGSQWKQCIPVNTVGRFSCQNILKKTSGATSYAKRNINSESVLSARLLLVDKTILNHITEFTETEARRVLESDDWSLSREELIAYISILYARGISAVRNLELHSLWSSSWGLNFCKETMPRDRFCEISRYLRFDLKLTRRDRLKQDKFAMISEVWNRFIENCVTCYKPGQNITIDEQLFPSKTRCPFTQFITLKPDKYGQKFWLAADVETKYVLNAFPYLGKNEERDKNQRLSEYVVLKLIESFQNVGRNVTVDNFFTSLELAKKLKEKRTSLVGTMN
ncbi:piggyBac transposable element-derived protein 4-like [Parasteatoda tepidariorum]|uniref:piggyBac transposable element-derived protein 4-like n=1 Tax=Parasteatoda tepidariorum TaxID=114398 RepID=UPI0039BD7941